MKIADFLSRLQNVKPTSKGNLARCPSHDDQANSLSIAEGDDGREKVIRERFSKGRDPA